MELLRFACRGWLLGLALAVGGLVLPRAAVADGMYCGNRLVKPGDTHVRVRARCGEPIAKQVRRGVSSVTFGWPYGATCRGPRARCGGRYGLLREVVIEEWFYDRGTHQLTQRLVFEDGILVRITTGPYGDIQPEASQSRQERREAEGPRVRLP